MNKRLLSALMLFCMSPVFMACSVMNKPVAAVKTAEPIVVEVCTNASKNCVKQQSTPFDHLSKTTIADGEGPIQAIEREEEVKLAVFANLGVAVVRKGNPIAYFADKSALEWSNVLYMPTINKGDVVYYGKVADVANAMSGFSQEDFVTLTSRQTWDQDTQTQHFYVYANGGIYSSQTVTAFASRKNNDFAGWFVSLNSCNVDAAKFAAEMAKLQNSRQVYQNLNATCGQ